VGRGRFFDRPSPPSRARGPLPLELKPAQTPVAYCSANRTRLERTGHPDLEMRSCPAAIYRGIRCGVPEAVASWGGGGVVPLWPLNGLVLVAFSNRKARQIGAGSRRATVNGSAGRGRSTERQWTLVAMLSGTPSDHETAATCSGSARSRAIRASSANEDETAPFGAGFLSIGSTVPGDVAPGKFHTVAQGVASLEANGRGRVGAAVRDAHASAELGAPRGPKPARSELPRPRFLGLWRGVPVRRSPRVNERPLLY